VGGKPCVPVSVELTYGPERLAMYLQGVSDYRDLKWSEHVTYGELYYEQERQFSIYNFESADVPQLWEMFEQYENEARAVLEKSLPLPAYDYVLKCSHTFNLLDSRGAVSVSQRAAIIGRIRRLAFEVAREYLARREEMGFPLLREGAK
jgi:glycyl-tRNA synthetase alpha chain